MAVQLLTDKLNFCTMFFPDGSEPAQSTTPNLTEPFRAFEAVANLLYTESYAAPSPLQSTAHVPFPRKTSFIWLRLYVERKCTGGAKAACIQGRYQVYTSNNARPTTRSMHIPSGGTERRTLDKHTFLEITYNMELRVGGILQS